MPTFRTFGLLLLLIPVGCSKPQANTNAVPTVASSSSPVVVTVTRPISVSLNWSIEQPGTVQAFESTPVVAKLSGFVRTVKVDLGDVVVAGQLLAELSIPELVEEAAQKRAMVEFAVAERVQSVKGVEVAKAQLKSSEAMVLQAKAGTAKANADFARWESELKRAEKLVADRVLDTQTLDETKRQYQSAVAAKEQAVAVVASADQMVLEMQAKLGRADADIQAAEAKKGVATAEAARVAALVEYTQIRAPFGGVVTARMVHTGHFLQPTAGSRVEPMFVVARQDIVRVFLEVPEAAADKASLGAKATVRIPAMGNREYPATITRTSRIINPETRTLRVEIDLDNKDGAIRPGVYAVVRIAVSTPSAIVVPAAAVLFADETAYCYTVENGNAIKRRVQVGKTDGGNLEILGTKPVSGPPTEYKPLTGDVKIVVGNLGSLADGQPVTEKK